MLGLKSTHPRPDDVLNFSCEFKRGIDCLVTGELRVDTGMRRYQGQEWCLQHDPFRRETHSRFAHAENKARSGCSDSMGNDNTPITMNSLDLDSGTSWCAVYHCIAAMICFHGLSLLMTWQIKYTSTTSRFLLVEDFGSVWETHWLPWILSFFSSFALAFFLISLSFWDCALWLFPTSFFSSKAFCFKKSFAHITPQCLRLEAYVL